MIAPDEERHLLSGPRPGEMPGGVGTINVLGEGGPGARVILERCRDVMAVVLEHSGPRWPAEHEWPALLPEWFIAACAPERSQAEAQRWLAWWRTLGPEAKAAAERDRRWTLTNWLFWLEPAERQWYWWDSETCADGRLRVAVEVGGWPAALGALDWLLRAAGAIQVTHEEV
jgi:hypothetical protein